MPTVAQFTLFPYTTLFRSEAPEPSLVVVKVARLDTVPQVVASVGLVMWTLKVPVRSEEHTSELQSRGQVVWRLVLEEAREEIVQVRPALMGRTSEMVKPWA